MGAEPLPLCTSLSQLGPQNIFTHWDLRIFYNASTSERGNRAEHLSELSSEQDQVGGTQRPSSPCAEGETKAQRRKETADAQRLTVTCYRRQICPSAADVPFPTLSLSSATMKHLLEVIWSAGGRARFGPRPSGWGPSIPHFQGMCLCLVGAFNCSLTKVRVLTGHYWERLWIPLHRSTRAQEGHPAITTTMMPVLVY